MREAWRQHLSRSGQSQVGWLVTWSVATLNVSQVPGPGLGPKKLLNSLLEGGESVTARLEAELLSARLAEADSLATLQQVQQQLRTAEQQLAVWRGQADRAGRQVTRLEQEAELAGRKAGELARQLRESEIKQSNLAGKLQDEQLMARIRCDNSHKTVKHMNLH